MLNRSSDDKEWAHLPLPPRENGCKSTSAGEGGSSFPCRQLGGMNGGRPTFQRVGGGQLAENKGEIELTIRGELPERS